VLDAVVAGAGPGGIAAALAIREQSPDASIAMLEVGHGQSRRPCPVDAGRKCRGCGGICNVVSGFGGCMHYGDGVKLSLFPSGRRLGGLFGEDRAEHLSTKAFGYLNRYLPEPVQLRGHEIPARMETTFAQHGMDIRPYPVATIGEGSLTGIIDGLYQDLRGDVTIMLDTGLTNVRRNGDFYDLDIVRPGGERSVIQTRALVLATGRRGLVTTQQVLKQLGVSAEAPAPSVGVRFEMRSSLLEAVGLGHPDLKVSQRDRPRKTKSFCFCGGSNGGRVKYTNYQTAFGLPVITLDGHETLDRLPPADRELAGNFGLMCQLPPDGQATDPEFQERLFGLYREIADGRPIAQRLRTFEARTDEPMAWPDLARSLPFEPSVNDLRTGPVHALLSDEQHAAISLGFRDLMGPILDVAGDDRGLDALLDQIVVLGLEVEFLWNRVPLSEDSETNISNLFVVGDAAGYAQGIVQAMMMGLAAGQRIGCRVSARHEARV